MRKRTRKSQGYVGSIFLQGRSIMIMKQSKSERVGMVVFYLLAIWAVVLWGVYFVENTKMIDRVANINIEQIEEARAQYESGAR